MSTTPNAGGAGLGAGVTVWVTPTPASTRNPVGRWSRGLVHNGEGWPGLEASWRGEPQVLLDLGHQLLHVSSWAGRGPGQGGGSRRRGRGGGQHTRFFDAGHRDASCGNGASLGNRACRRLLRLGFNCGQERDCSYSSQDVVRWCLALQWMDPTGSAVLCCCFLPLPANQVARQILRFKI